MRFSFRCPYCSQASREALSVGDEERRLLLIAGVIREHPGEKDLILEKNPDDIHDYPDDGGDDHGG
jgi:hypothetical protein